MSFNSSSQWLSLKHHSKPAKYSFSCGEQDADWEFPESSRYSGAYTFSSESNPIQLLNNAGGMDEDTVEAKNIWYPHNKVPETEEVDSDMCDSSSRGDMMDLDADEQSNNNRYNDFRSAPLQQSSTSNCAAAKRKRGPEKLDMSAGIAHFPRQRIDFANIGKRVRVTA